MSTKGKSNLYGRGKRGEPNDNINYKYGKYLSHRHQEDHIDRHGIREMGLTRNQYKSQAVAFANKVDRENHVSFIRRNGETFKYSKITGELAVISKEGIVETYYKSNDKWWEGAKKKYEKK